MSSCVNIKDPKWQNINYHQISYKLITNGHTYEIFYMLDEII